MAPLHVTKAVFTAAEPRARATGLLGFLRIVFNDTLSVDAITVRRTRYGKLTFSYPAHRDRFGKVHHVVRPVDDIARRYLEHQLLVALRVERGA